MNGTRVHCGLGRKSGIHSTYHVNLPGKLARSEAVHHADHGYQRKGGSIEAKRSWAAIVHQQTPMC